MIFDRTNIQCDGNQIKVIVSPAAGFDGARREIAQFKTEVNQRVDEVEDLVVGIGSGEGGKAYDSLADALAADIPDNIVFQTPEGYWRRDSSLTEGAEFLREFPTEFELERANENIFNPYYLPGVGKAIEVGGPGNLIDYPDYYSTDFIEWGEEARASVTWGTRLSQYDSDKNYILNSYAHLGTNGTSSPSGFDRAENAKFFRLSVHIDRRFEARATFVDSGSALRTYESFAVKIKGTKEGIPIVYPEHEAPPIPETQEFEIIPASEAIFNPYYEEGIGKDIRSGGDAGLIDAPDYYSTDLIEWKVDEVRFRAIYIRAVAQYDVNKVYIPGSYNYVSATGTPNPRSFSRAEGAEFLRICTSMDNRFRARATFVDEESNGLRTEEPFEMTIARLKEGTPLVFPVSDSQVAVAINRNAINEIAAIARPYATVNRFNIIHFSDIHFNARNAAKNMEELIEFSKLEIFNGILEAVIFTGDACDGFAGRDKDTTLNELSNYMEKALELDVTTLPCIGNHDDNINFIGDTSGSDVFEKALLKSEQFETQIKPLSDKWGGINTVTDKGYHYCDFVDDKIRVITLDCYDLPIVDNGAGGLKYRGHQYYSQAQLDWFNTTLQSTPSDYGLIISHHNPLFEHPGTPLQGISLIPSIVNAYKNGTSFSHSYEDPEFSELNTAKEFNFSEGKEFIAYLCGHRHWLEFGKAEGFPDQHCIMVNAACSSGAYRPQSEELRNSFNIVSIDRDDRKIFITVYGDFRHRDGEVLDRVTILDY